MSEISIRSLPVGRMQFVTDRSTQHSFLKCAEDDEPMRVIEGYPST